MTTSKVIRRLLPILILLLLGIWFLRQPASLPPDPVTGRPALAPAAGPAAPGSQTPLQTAPPTLTLSYPAVAPSTVHFAAARQDTTPPDNVSPHLLRPETAIPGEARLQALRSTALQRPPSPDLQQATVARAPAAPLVAFEGIDYNQSSGQVPPDPELAAGPNHLMAAVNTSVSVYGKSGNLLFGPTAASNLFSHPSCLSGLYDPNVVYDEEADRWLLAYDKGARRSDGGYCLLASQGPDPLGEWSQYFFPLNDGSAWLDFPHAGVGDRYLFMGGNMFDYQSPPRFVEGRLFAFNKNDLYDPVAAVTPVALRLGVTYDTPQPLHLHGARQGSWPAFGNSHYFLAEPWDGRRYTLFRWDPTLPVANLSQVTVGTVDLGSGDDSTRDLLPVYVPQQDGDLLEPNDFRPLDFEYRNGYGWTTMTVACNPGGETVNCVRWAQIDLTDATLGPAGAGLYGSAGQYRFFPDLAVNQCNDMLVGYTRSASDAYPGIWVAGRYGTDASGQLRGEQALHTGDRTYTSAEVLTSERPARRWGDYTGLTIDPDGITFWYLGQYSKNITNAQNTNWGTYAGSFTLSPDLSCARPGFDHQAHLPLVSNGTLPPGPTRVTLKAEDFEGDFPNQWRVYDPAGTTYYWDETGCRAAGGANSGGAVAAADLACGTSYPPNTASWMVYGPVDLGDAGDAALQFDFWNQSEREHDSFFWGVSIDGQNLYGYAYSGDTGGWLNRTLDLKNVPGLGDIRGERQVLVAFVFSSDGAIQSGEGTYLDNIYLWKETGGRYPAAPATREDTDPQLRPETRVLPPVPAGAGP